MKNTKTVHNIINSAFAFSAKAIKTTCGFPLAGAVALALQPLSPVLYADGDTTVFGKHLGGNNAPQQRQPQQQPEQNTSSAGTDASASVGASREVLVGPHWVHPVETFIFAKDGSVWSW